MHARTHNAFPFAAIVGMDAARQALLLLAVDPGLKGVLIASGPGTAKSLLARSFRSLVPNAPFLELPLGITDDRLLGLTDQARGGFLHADELNLLDRTHSRHVAGALSARSDLALIAGIDPAEGGVDAALADALALHVAESEPADRLEILRRVAAFNRDPVAFANQFAPETSSLRELVSAAKRRLPNVNASLEDRRRLAAAAVRLGVQGNRADIFALSAACAHAALKGRTCLEEEDLQAAVRLVLSPRARPQSEAAADAPASPPQQTADGPAEDRVIDAVDCAIPEQVLNIAARAQQQWQRGRCIRTVRKRPEATRISVVATLVAAAPFQTAGPPIRITPRDLRYKQFRENTGILIVFAVDASGSMAVNRIHLAKGAVIRLLGKAYLNRDQVALVGFRGEGAEVLLGPTRGVELAKRALDAMPVGGGTPLAAGLESSLELIHRARLVGREALLVLLTDGKANIGLPRELEQVCSQLRKERVASVVIDTTHRAVSSGAACGLAEMIGGRLVYLPHSHPNAICDVVIDAARVLRS